MCADDRGCLWDIFLIPQTERKKKKTSAHDWSIYGKLFRENPLHCSCRTRSSQVKCNPAIPLVLNVLKENCVTEVQLVAEGVNDVLWEQCSGFPSHFTLEIPLGSGSYLSLCNIKEHRTKKKKSLRIWLRGMEDKMRDWKCLRASYYRDTRFSQWKKRLIAQWTEGGQTGNRAVCILATAVLPVLSL